MSRDLVARLHDVELLIEVPREGLALLAETARERRFLAGEPLLLQGEVPTSLFLIANGCVAIERDHPDLLRPVILGERYTGEVVGEFGLLTTTPARNTIRAITDMTAFEIPRAAFADLLSCFPMDDPLLRAVLLPPGMEPAELESSVVREHRTVHSANAAV